MSACRQIVTIALLALLGTNAQSVAQKQVSPADGEIVGQNSTVQDSSGKEEPDVKAAAPSVDSAWAMLVTAAHKGVQPRVLTMAALGTMGANPRAATMIEEGMKDTALDVRIAAVLAAGQTKNRALLPALRGRLADAEPQVVFTSAVTLWKLNDHSGEDILKAVIVGDRKATPTLMHGAKNDVNHELHDPGALAGLGATEGAALLLGPFGFGVTAFEYMKKSGGNPARAEAINLLADSRVPGVRDDLLAALYDKDTSVRAAAARALGKRRDPGAVKPLGELFNDTRLPVRLTAAAAYINCSHTPASKA
jgi:HEAT repeat protein